MQRRELDRDARPVRQRRVAGGRADRLDGVGVGLEIALGVGRRARALAQHVEGIADSAALARARARQRLARSSGRARNGCRGRRIACRVAVRTAGRPSRLASWPRMLSGVSPGWMMRAVMPSAQAEAETRNASERVSWCGEVALAELVLDQPVGGRGVGHAQQRLGQHHEGEALVGRQRIFAQQILDAAEPARLASGSPRSSRVARVVDPRARAPRAGARPPADGRAIAASSGSVGARNAGMLGCVMGAILWPSRRSWAFGSVPNSTIRTYRWRIRVSMAIRVSSL